MIMLTKGTKARQSNATQKVELSKHNGSLLWWQAKAAERRGKEEVVPNGSWTFNRAELKRVNWQIWNRLVFMSLPAFQFYDLPGGIQWTRKFTKQNKTKPTEEMDELSRQCGKKMSHTSVFSNRRMKGKRRVQEDKGFLLSSKVGTSQRKSLRLDSTPYRWIKGTLAPRSSLPPNQSPITSWDGENGSQWSHGAALAALLKKELEGNVITKAFSENIINTNHFRG